MSTNIKMQEKGETITALKGSTCSQWLTAILVNGVMFIYGVGAGWGSPMGKVLQGPDTPMDKPITAEELSWCVSIVALTAGFISPFYSMLADKYGRRTALILVSFVQLVAWTMTFFSTTGWHLIVSRAVCGIANAGAYVITPMYIREISEDHIRGSLGSLVSLLQNIGILSMFVMGTYLNYNLTLWIIVPLPLLLMLALFKAPESPSFLAKQGKTKELTATVAYLRGLSKDSAGTQAEVKNLMNGAEYFKSLPDITLYSIVKNRVYRKIIALVVTMLTVQALSGNFAVISYAAIIMAEFKVTINPDLQTMSFPVVMIAGAMVSMTFVERFGRRPLMVTTATTSSLCFVTLGTIMMLQQNGYSVPGWLPGVVIIVSVFSYSSGVAPLPYVVMAESLNFQIRSRVMGYMLCYGWLMSFVQLKTFAPVSMMLGMHSTFFLFAVINIVGAIVSVLFLPETKGKTTEQIEESFRNK
ncbi:facilitated trehalose transporter Tret1 [Plutella xylostella]|uniref:facilitated trehalose transporter Tret1 n=1 Tax=Plutella xylostella TaxID=51655 RepID=UPI002032B2D2|nr:facilitated trehalose transporter Tret1 [Plutella xylostella]